MVDFFFILEDVLISIAMLTIINALGAKGLPLSYRSFVDAFDEQNSMFNIGYRIFSPIVVLMIIALLIKAFAPSFDSFATFYSIIFYWILRLIAWILHRKQLQTNLLMFVAQASISILLCLYLFCTAMRDPIENLLPQSSDISLEFVLVVLFVVLQILSQSKVFRKEDYHWALQEECERDLYSFERTYSSLFSERMKQDVALRTLFYAIALTENHYRPAAHRKIERILAKLGFKRLGLVKTTGLMQVTSDHVLTDEESVCQSIPIIEGIFDKYLLSSNRFSIHMNSYPSQSTSNFVTLFETGYSYDLEYLFDSIRFDIGSLYGKYSGSNLSNPQFFFSCAKNFVENKEYEQGHGNVEVNSPLCTPFDGIAFGAWCRIERHQGLAVRVNKQRVTVLHSATQVPVSEISAYLIELGLANEVVLLVNLFGNTTLAVREGAVDDAQASNLSHKYGLCRIGEGCYSFNPFIANPEMFLADLVAGNTPGVG